MGPGDSTTTTSEAEAPKQGRDDQQPEEIALSYWLATWKQACEKDRLTWGFIFVIWIPFELTLFCSQKKSLLLIQQVKSS